VSKCDRSFPVVLYVHVCQFVIGLIISYFVVETAKLTAALLFKIVTRILRCYQHVIGKHTG